MPQVIEKPELKIVGVDGNAFVILGKATAAARKAGWDDKKIDEVIEEAMEGDYDHLLRTMSKYFDCQ